VLAKFLMSAVFAVIVDVVIVEKVDANIVEGTTMLLIVLSNCRLVTSCWFPDHNAPLSEGTVL
jgi:hypothetical protein